MKLPPYKSLAFGARFALTVAVAAPVAGCVVYPAAPSGGPIITTGGGVAFCQDDNAIGILYKSPHTGQFDNTPRAEAFIVTFPNGGDNQAIIDGWKTVPGGTISFGTTAFSHPYDNMLDAYSIGGVNLVDPFNIYPDNPNATPSSSNALTRDAHMALADAKAELFDFGVPVRAAPSSSATSCSNYSYYSGIYFQSPNGGRFLTFGSGFYQPPPGFYSP